MTDEERNDLLELKVFLEKAIPLTERQLINYPASGSTEDYQFLIGKAIMYRETLKQVNQQLKTDEN